MGQKVNPNLIRLGITKLWNSNWFSNKNNFSKYLLDDYNIRKIIFKNLKKALVSKIVIERLTHKISIKLYAGRAGIILSRNSDDLLKLRYKIEKIIPNLQLQFTVTEIEKTEIDANLIGQNVAFQIKKRISFRRILKRIVKNAIKRGAKGIKIELSGRLNGGDIARTHWYREGRVPLNTFRAQIDYCCTKSFTSYGVVGIKVWVFTGEFEYKLDYKKKEEEQKDIFMPNKNEKRNNDIKLYDAT